MTEKSQQRVPHVVFIMFIGIPRGAQGRTRKRGRGVGPSIANQDLRHLYWPSQTAQGPAELRWTHFNASSLVARVCRMSLPVSVRVLFNLRNYLWLASLDMRWSGTRATTGGCGASRRPRRKRWRFACLRSTLLFCTVWWHRPMVWVWLSSHHCSAGRVTKSSSTEKVSAATDVSEKKSFYGSPFYLEFDEEAMKPEDCGAKKRRNRSTYHENEATVPET